MNRQELRCVNEALAVGGMGRNCKSELGLTQVFFLGHVLEQESLVFANGIWKAETRTVEKKQGFALQIKSNLFERTEVC